tara:strand:- start:18 stop:536 length:519 start_codon:yes stop_codon:yes gene_type:complete
MINLINKTSSILAIFILSFSIFSSSDNTKLTRDSLIALDGLIDGLHKDAHEGNYQAYFNRYSSGAVFLGTDKTERWTISEFKAYAKPAFADGHGWTYEVVERNWEGSGDNRWFDEILFNQKYGHCRGTGVVEFINGEWKIAHYSLTLLVPNDIAAEVGLQTQKAEKQKILSN